MISNLPFTALRAFEAVVRLQGFARAAEELAVTQSAVSQQVKSLEEWLGRRLVDRKPGRTQPTEDGRRLAAAVAENFGNIASVCHEIRDANQPNLTIVLSALPGFAYIWLIPRLINFNLRHPQYEVSILTSQTPPNFAVDEADVSIRYGSGTYPGLHVETLMRERLFPVCSPELLQKTPLNSVEDLANHTLLVDDIGQSDGPPPTWENWAREMGKSLPQPARSMQFGQSNMVVQAAVRGFGVALGREPLVIDELEAGRLVRPFPELATSHYSYSIVCPKAALESERISAIRNWLHDEVREQAPITDASLFSPPAGHSSKRENSCDSPKQMRK